ncbi:RHS repeat-associated core domain-containing protein [Photobacterium sp. Hal280]|uniref:RHS repeat-associated core domain-containing protein n=1 Tax=Photobacterium sp. Hal280 TaxID=3035163 RepID=UPI00301D9912
MNGEQAQFDWLGNTLLRESGPQGQKDYTYGATGYAPVTVDADGQVADVLSDHLSAPVGLIQAQNLIWQQARSPFGVTLESIPQPILLNIGLPGQYNDSESGLSYNLFRDYDTRTGRYVQYDPIGLTGGVNPFIYVVGNPLNYVDPLGHSAVAVVGGWISTDTAIPDPTDAAWPKWVGYGIAIGGAALIDWIVYNNEEGSTGDSNVCPIPDFDFDDPTKSPIGEDGEEWVWKGKEPQGGPYGGYKNPNGPESLHPDPDLDHGEPVGPHWDLNDRKGPGWRIYPDGTVKPK